ENGGVRKHRGASGDGEASQCERTDSETDRADHGACPPKTVGTVFPPRLATRLPPVTPSQPGCVVIAATSVEPEATATQLCYCPTRERAKPFSGMWAKKCALQKDLPGA